jgi:predicted RNase H-like HicB family nuclease
MSKWSKLLFQILHGEADANVDFDDLCHLLQRRIMAHYEIVIYWSSADNVFVAEVPELPGCAAHGDTQEMALRNAKAAIGLWLDTAREFGDAIPEPKGSRLLFA